MGKPGMKPPTISRSRTSNFHLPTAFTRKLPGQPSSSGRTDSDYLVELHAKFSRRQYAQDCWGRVRRELLTNTNNEPTMIGGGETGDLCLKDPEAENMSDPSTSVVNARQGNPK